MSAEVKMESSKAGLPHAEKLKKTELLDEKCKKFSEYVKREKIESPSKEVLTKFFSKAEVITLWKRFELARGKESLTVREAWDDLVKEGRGKSEARRMTTLALFAAGIDGGREWANKLMTISEEIRHVRSSGTKKRKLYWGELVTQHGWDEACKFVESGKFKKVLDKDGDECYVKTTEVATDITSCEASASSSKRLALVAYYYFTLHDTVTCALRFRIIAECCVGYVCHCSRIGFVC